MVDSKIISASRRTDVPAFFGEWFMRRLQEGYVVVRNPMNHRHIRRVELAPDKVSGIVFWTKNPKPFLKYLPQLDAMGYVYYFQFTLNPYSKEIEGGLPALTERVETFQHLAERLGPKRVVWRYDPIILGSGLTVEWHMAQYSSLAQKLQGCTERCVISFLDFYTKTLRSTRHLGLRPITSDEMHACGRFIGDVAKAHGIAVYACCEAVDLTAYAISRASCIDADLIAEIAGVPVEAPRDQGQRPGCGCASSIDVGVYNTCLHQCAYCYANTSAKAVRENARRHDPNSPLLIP